jgi:hypothetical protein
VIAITIGCSLLAQPVHLRVASDLLPSASARRLISLLLSIQQQVTHMKKRTRPAYYRGFQKEYFSDRDRTTRDAPLSETRIPLGS